MKSIITITLMVATLAIFGQGPHSQLIDITKSEAQAMADELSLSDVLAKKLTNIYVKHALATEDIIVSSEPDLDVLKEVKTIKKAKSKDIRALFNNEDFELYRYKIDQAEKRAGSQFDSLQVHLNNPEFNDQVIAYFDQNVSPYLIYYHQTYLRPALKQKHYFKINQLREKLQTTQFRIDSLELASNGDAAASASMRADLSSSLKELRRIRKRYMEQLDYINVAIGPVEREWNKDYIQMVQTHYKDDVYQDIAAYSSYLNAYGISYLVGGYSLLLFDLYYPRGYVEYRDLLIDLVGTR